MEGVYDAVMQNFRSFMLAEDGDLDDIHDFMKEKERDSEGAPASPEALMMALKWVKIE